jgi:hypothetical protein
MLLPRIAVFEEALIESGSENHRPFGEKGF